MYVYHTGCRDRVPLSIIFERNEKFNLFVVSLTKFPGIDKIRYQNGTQQIVFLGDRRYLKLIFNMTLSPM